MEIFKWDKKRREGRVHHLGGRPNMSFTFAVSVSVIGSLYLPSIPITTLRQCQSRALSIKPLRCAPIHTHDDAETGIMCEPCNGRGWLLCHFCNGQKTNVKAQNNKRIYRRCPSCKAVGYVLCSNCKVFKCLTFPNFNDSQS